MKKITLLFLLLAVSLGYSQVVLEDFEGTPDLGEFGGTAATVEADPVVGSNTAGKLVVTAGAGDPWQGANLLFQGNYIDVSDPVANTVSIDVHSDVPFSLFAKLAGGQAAAVDSAADEAHGGTGWETLTFTFNENLDGTASANGEYSTLAIFPNWNGAGWHNPPIDSTIYVDNISGTLGAAIPLPPAGPTTSPGAPTNLPADVIGVYGDTYTSIVTNDNPNWGQTGAVNGAYDPGDGSALLAYTNFNYQGTEVTNPTDASDMEFLHVDMWTVADPAATTVQVSPINGGTGATGTVETLVTIPFTSGTWVSVDLPIGDFTGMTWDAINQMKFAANGPGSTVPVDIYLDNIYFWKAPALVNDDCAGAMGIALATSVAFDNTGAGDSGVDSCFTGDVRDLWYSFAAPASGEVTITVGAGAQYALFSDCTTEVSCNTADNTGLTAAATYYLTVTDDGTNRVPGAGTVQVDDTATLSTTDFASKSLFSYYPNPINNALILNAQNAITNVIVFNMLGQEVIRTAPNAVSNEVDMSNLQSGAYFVQVTVGTELETVRVIKN